jgi:putative transposase
MKQVHSSINLQQLCKLLGYSSQAYHKHNKKQFSQQLNEGLILQQIDSIRKLQPRCGGRKLFIELQPFFLQHSITMGRDKFFDLLKRNKLLVRKTKRSVRTTNSKHHYYRYPNLVKGFTPLKAHELWVADITYIPLKERFAYLFLITDAYSRKIVGFHVSDDMKVSSAVLALKKALVQKPPETIVIHHSDRGIQYCSTEYVNLLLEHHAMISMTNNGDPLENAVAERVNGILKTELINSLYNDIDAASIHITRCITIYNHRRRHSSLNWQIPAEVHNQKGPQIRRWKNYYQNNTKTKPTMPAT